MNWAEAEAWIGQMPPSMQRAATEIRFPLPEVDTMQLKVVLEPSEEGGFTVLVPALPGCISEGDTREEALANIREAITLYLEPVEDDLARSPDSEIAEVAI
jgi:predicted RNase H-like HicB family nuclease